MPTYVYACTNPDCGHRFEAVQAFTDDALTACPVCGQRVRKVFGSVGVVFKGSGFYRNDSRAGAAEGSSADKSGDKPASDGSKDTASGKDDAGSKSTGSDSGSTGSATKGGSESKGNAGGTKGSSESSGSGSGSESSSRSPKSGAAAPTSKAS